MLLRLAAVMLLWLLLLRSPGAVWWAIAVAFCTGFTVILKVAFYDCPPTPDLHNPSGHTSFSTLVYGAMAPETATEHAGLRRILSIGAGAGFVVAIEASRLLLYAHSAPEVGLGLAIGIFSLTVFGQEYLRCRVARVWLFPLFVVGAVVLLLLHGRELDAEQLFRAIAGYLRIDC